MSFIAKARLFRFFFLICALTYSNFAVTAPSKVGADQASTASTQQPKQQERQLAQKQKELEWVQTDMQSTQSPVVSTQTSTLTSVNSSTPKTNFVQGSKDMTSIVAGSPDLMPSEVKVSPPLITSGKTIRVSWTMANKGNGDAKASVTGLRMKAVWAGSLKTVCTDSYITLVREIATSPIEAGRSINMQHDVTVPADAPAGGYVVVVVADNSKSNPLDQKDTSNDYAQSGEVTLIGQSAISTGRPLMADMELVPEGGFADPLYPRGQKFPAEHVGTDYKAAGGSCVFAVREGKVFNKTKNADPMAAVLKVTHGDGSGAYYGHIESSLSDGSKVSRGTLLGTVRRPTATFGSHLHYGEWEPPTDTSIKDPEVDCEKAPWVIKKDENWGWGRVPKGTTQKQILDCGWIDTGGKYKTGWTTSGTIAPSNRTEPTGRLVYQTCFQTECFKQYLVKKKGSIDGVMVANVATTYHFNEAGYSKNEHKEEVARLSSIPVKHSTYKVSCRIPGGYIEYDNGMLIPEPERNPPHATESAYKVWSAVCENVSVVPSPSKIYGIVSAGENAPESIVRVLSVKTIAPGKRSVDVAGGPCRDQSKARSNITVDSNESLSVGDLFFSVPISSPNGGFALRRATPTERSKYDSCRWR